MLFWAALKVVSALDFRKTLEKNITDYEVCMCEQEDVPKP